MKILILADINDLRWKGGDGQADLLLSCGDVADQVILEAAASFNCSRIFAVKGNHDSSEDFPSKVTDLHLRVDEFGGLRLGGLKGAWRYKEKGHFLYDQWEVDQFLSSFPRVDLFLSHNSPRGIHDREDGVHCGFEGLRSYIERIKPRLLIHGHQHLNCETRFGETRIVGVCGHRLLEIRV
jgi:Icc-related predicted phosphoesterase